MHAVGFGVALSARASDINQTSTGTVPAAVPGTYVENFCRQRRTSRPGRRRERGIREGEEKRKKYPSGCSKKAIRALAAKPIHMHDDGIYIDRCLPCSAVHDSRGRSLSRRERPSGWRNYRCF